MNHTLEVLDLTQATAGPALYIKLEPVVRARGWVLTHRPPCPYPMRAGRCSCVPIVYVRPGLDIVARHNACVRAATLYRALHQSEGRL